MLTGHRDTDKYLTQFLKDDDLINLCKAIPDLKIWENFWKERFISKYGICEKTQGKTQGKSQEKSWKKFYLQIFYYLDSYSLNQAMILAAEQGEKDLVNFFISQGADDFINGFYGAALAGHQDLVEVFKQKMFE